MNCKRTAMLQIVLERSGSGCRQVQAPHPASRLQARSEGLVRGDDWQSVHLFRSGRKIAGRSKDILRLSGRDQDEKAKKQEQSIAMKRTTKKIKS